MLFRVRAMHRVIAHPPITGQLACRGVARERGPPALARHARHVVVHSHPTPLASDAQANLVPKQYVGV